MPFAITSHTVAELPRRSIILNSRGVRALAGLAAVIAAGVSGVAYLRYREDIRRARQRVSSSSQIAQTICGPIEYAAAGNGDPVLLVHGAGGGYDQGLDFGEPLAQHGLRIIAMSRFGYLRSPLPVDASAAAQADAHACLLDAFGIQRAAVIGGSAGAPSSMQFALRHPERCSALVLLVPAAYVPHPGDAQSLQTPPWTGLLFDAALKSDFLFWIATRVARSTVIEAILATPFDVVKHSSSEEQARINDTLEHVLPISPRRLGLLNDANIVSSLERYDLEHIAVPTLIIGVADCLFGTFDPALYTARHIPGARFVQYDTGGHLWVGHQQEVVAEIVAFLKGTAGPAGGLH